MRFSMSSFYAGDGDSMLSKHSLFVRRVHAVLATSLHVLRHERHRAVHSALRARHGRLLSAAGCWTERWGRGEINTSLWCPHVSLMAT